jgi:phospholipase D1/2
MPIVPPPTTSVRRRRRAATSGRAYTWIRIASVLVFLALLAAAWKWTPLKSLVDLPRIVAWSEPYRDAWYALPLVMAAFVLLGLVMVPVLLMILATGIAFGPWLGSLYAMAGCLASASVGFVLGRWAGPRRVERIAGPRVQRLSESIKRNGTLAVYLVRKIPAPYTLANVMVGATGVPYRDFVLGTTLGMMPMVVALAGFGYQLSRIAKEPTPAGIAAAVAFLAVPLSLALLLNHLLKKRRKNG